MPCDTTLYEAVSNIIMKARLKVAFENSFVYHIESGASTCTLVLTFISFSLKHVFNLVSRRAPPNCSNTIKKPLKVVSRREQPLKALVSDVKLNEKFRSEHNPFNEATRCNDVFSLEDYSD